MCNACFLVEYNMMRCCVVQFVHFSPNFVHFCPIHVKGNCEPLNKMLICLILRRVNHGNHMMLLSYNLKTDTAMFSFASPSLQKTFLGLNSQKLPIIGVFTSNLEYELG